MVKTPATFVAVDRATEGIGPVYSANGFVCVRRCIQDQAQVAGLLAATRSLPPRQVVCDQPNISWKEQFVPQDNPLHQLFLSEVVVAKIHACMGSVANRIKQTHCWTSTYAIAEYINQHRDRDGDFQVILCLTSPESENGGLLCVYGVRSEIRLCLSPGDGVFFQATKVEHYTTPLVPTPSNRNPKRVVGVCRYWFG